MKSSQQNNGLRVRQTPSNDIALQALKESAITPGLYTPTTSFLTSKSIGIAMDGTPIVLLGFAGDKDSDAVADRLLTSKQFRALVKYEFGEYKELRKTIISNDTCFAHQEYNAIVESKQGDIECGDEQGRLEAVLPVGSEAFGFGICVSNELGKCFFPDAVDIHQDITLD